MTAPGAPSAGAAVVVALGLWAAALPGGVAPAMPCPEGLLCGRPVDVNRAPRQVLEALPGIGPVRARAIAAARPFARVEDLRRVPGIGPATLAALRGSVEVRAGGSRR